MPISDRRCRSQKNRTRALDNGAVGFLSKPFDEASLIKCLTAAIKLRELDAAGDIGLMAMATWSVATGFDRPAMQRADELLE